MNPQRTWEAALEEAQLLLERQNRDFNAAMSVAQRVGLESIELDERALRELAECTANGGRFPATQRSNWFSGSRC
ncbi:MAG TPA: hypothetical protein VER11_13055 [Polyangiaceae bacterium]|nr:hypothetical protein [Polyangiaceae bacterium]